MGMTQKEAVSAIIKDYDLPLSPDQYIQEILPFYQGKWVCFTLYSTIPSHFSGFTVVANSYLLNISFSREWYLYKLLHNLILVFIEVGISSLHLLFSFFQLWGRHLDNAMYTPIHESKFSDL